MTRKIGRVRSAFLVALAASAMGCAEHGASEDGLGGGGAGGGSPDACDVPGGLFVTGVLAHAFGPGQDVGQDAFPDLVFGPPRGGGTGAGSTDHVVSLGDGGFVELSFGRAAIVDGPGADFIVFENAFLVGGDEENPYAELGQVSVSRDGTEWVTFPCTRREYPYDQCAGWHPVLANPETNDVDPTDPDAAGGDAFDLGALELDWVRYVRIDDIVDEQELSFDLDAIAVVHPGCF